MECHICYKYSKLIKCDKCSFSCCEECIVKLETEEIDTEKLDYNCCVCKSSNSLKIDSLTNVSALRSLYKKRTKKLLENDDSIILLSNIVLIYNAPVLTLNVSYYKNAIVAVRNQQDNIVLNLELYDPIVELVGYENRINKFKEQSIHMNSHFVYSSNDTEYCLLKAVDFYELVNNERIDF